MSVPIALAVAMAWAEDMVVITDRSGTITYVNPAFCRTMGWSEAEAVGKTPAILKSGLQDAALYQAMWATITAGQVWKGELVNRRRDGSLLTTEQVISPVREADGSVQGFVSIARDVTRRKAAELAAEQASRAKSAFLATMSHELRTPLNAILGYAEIIEQELADAGRDDLLPDTARIRTAGKQLLAMINDVLDLATIEAGAAQVSLGPVPLAELVEEVAAKQAARLAEKGNALDLSCPDGLMVLADGQRLRQVMAALLSNAAKFTQSGQVRVTATIHGDMVELAVADTGVGMTAEQVGRLFGDVFQTAGVMTRQHEGAGIGLAICRRLVSLMNGSLAVDSAPGQGATFTLRLPRAE